MHTPLRFTFHCSIPDNISPFAHMLRAQRNNRFQDKHLTSGYACYLVPRRRNTAMPHYLCNDVKRRAAVVVCLALIAGPILASAQGNNRTHLIAINSPPFHYQDCTDLKPQLLHTWRRINVTSTVQHLAGYGI